MKNFLLIDDNELIKTWKRIVNNFNAIVGDISIYFYKRTFVILVKLDKQLKELPGTENILVHQKRSFSLFSYLNIGSIFMLYNDICL